MYLFIYLFCKTKIVCLLPVVLVVMTLLIYFTVWADAQGDSDIKEKKKKNSSAPLPHSRLNGADGNEQFSNNPSPLCCRLSSPL